MEDKIERLERALRVLLKAHKAESIHSMDPNIRFGVKAAEAILDGKDQDIPYLYHEFRK